MNILINGVSGYIGSHLVDKLVDTNNNIFGVDKQKPKNYDPEKSGYTFLKIDLTNFNDINKVCKDIEYIIHLAGEANVRASKKSIMKNNIDSSEGLIQAALSNRLK